ncbi:MAG: PHB depolymerase family esterase [Pseudomonadota bacterium]
MKLNAQMFAQMREATRNLLAKGPAAATAAIQQALAGLRQDGAKKAPHSGPASPPPPQGKPAMRDINPPPAGADTAARGARTAPPHPEATAPGFGARPQAPHARQEQSAQADPQTGAQTGAQGGKHPAHAFAEDLLARLGIPAGGGMDVGINGFEMPNFDLPGMRAPGGKEQELPPGGRFIAGEFSNHAGARSYKLYIPSTYHGQAMPLLVMLHGCTQDPDDFAAGTQMNAVAEEKQCFVVYPAQSTRANNHKCWNWFNALDQQRGQGEPSLIAGIAQQVIDEYPVKNGQVYVAGLSAGGAMAVIVGTLYPDLFAAVGVHSGLPYASARDLPSALSAMKRGAAGTGSKAAGAGTSVPIIVFHGDQDRTVHPRNGEQVMEQLNGHGAARTQADSGSVPNGHRYTRTTHSHPDGSPLGEHWVVHGAGHAWSGGSTSGSYTDGKGPDASREMMRFFTTVS